MSNAAERSRAIWVMCPVIERSDDVRADGRPSQRIGRLEAALDRAVTTNEQQNHCKDLIHLDSKMEEGTRL